MSHTLAAFIFNTMVHIIQIEDNNPEGKRLLTALRRMSRKSRALQFLTNAKFEALEDKALLAMMEEAMRGGMADTNHVLSKLGL
ncbi:MAG: hypothetical protein ACKVOR_01495 [Flavobacteriales bacterium]